MCHVIILHIDDVMSHEESRHLNKSYDQIHREDHTVRERLMAVPNGQLIGMEQRFFSTALDLGRFVTPHCENESDEHSRRGLILRPHSHIRCFYFVVWSNVRFTLTLQILIRGERSLVVRWKMGRPSWSITLVGLSFSLSCRQP
jgi:hypothetical protein